MNSLYPNLQARMASRGVSVEAIADIIGRSEEIVCQKIEGIQEWTLTEAVTICRYLEHPDLRFLFLRKPR